MHILRSFFSSDFKLRFLKTDTRNLDNKMEDSKCWCGPWRQGVLIGTQQHGHSQRNTATGGCYLFLELGMSLRGKELNQKYKEASEKEVVYV